MSLQTPYYQDDAVTLYHADCRDILPLLPAGSVDLVLTDPPYGATTHAGARTDDGTTALVTFASTTADALRAVMQDAQCAARWWVMTCEWQHAARLEAAPPDGWRFVRLGVWVKPVSAPQFTGDRPGTGWEAVAFMHRDGVRLRWAGKGRHGVWTHNKVNGYHPTTKPLPLVEEWVRLFSDGGTILDPFAGSGTTLVAAKRLGRKAIGIEIEERYCALAATRLSQEVLAL